MENEAFLVSQTRPQPQVKAQDDHDFSFPVSQTSPLLIFPEIQPQGSQSSSSTPQIQNPNVPKRNVSSLLRCKTAPAMVVMRDFRPKTIGTSKPQSESSIILSYYVYDWLWGHKTIYKTLCLLVCIGGFWVHRHFTLWVVNYVLDLQENMILAGIQMEHQRHRGFSTGDYIVDVAKGRMRIRLKVCLALGVVVLCIGLGILALHFLAELDWIDSAYLSAMSVTTVGYGDRAFKTLSGRLFAAISLLLSTLAVDWAFLYLAEARIDKRHRNIGKWVSQRDITFDDFLAADMNNTGLFSKSEYVMYKLKEMGNSMNLRKKEAGY